MNKRLIIVITGIVLIAAGFFLYTRRDSNLLTPAQANAMISRDTSVVILDVRTPAEFHGQTGHLAHAILLPVQELEQRVDELQQYKEKTILVYCRTGHRSTTASGILSNHGYHVFNMEGGITLWSSEQLPVVKD
jgi:rhodanese-related sulfurtransferase